MPVGRNLIWPRAEPVMTATRSWSFRFFLLFGERSLKAAEKASRRCHPEPFAVILSIDSLSGCP
jgi:hypothetical protein